VREDLGALDDQAGASQVLIAAGSLAQAIEQYNGQAQRHFDGLVEEFRGVTRVLLQRSYGLPDPLKQSLESALGVNELPALDTHLRRFRETVMNLPPEPARASEVTLRPNDASAPGAADPCTGLPTRLEAEATIRRAIGGTAQTYVIAFYVHRMNLINARFGDAIGNQVILFCSQHIATHLSGANDALFRWRGPGFVAVLERNESALIIASDVQRFTSLPLSRFFETPSRTVYLPIKLTAEVLPTAGKSADEVIEQVQKSLHAHGAEESS
jgi:GGDEF domain-containing protein